MGIQPKPIQWERIKFKGIPLTVSDRAHVIYKGRFLKQHDFNGYNYVCVRAKSIPVHHIVCKAFKSNYTYKCVPNHLDGNKKNNNASNFRCGTHRDNIIHAHNMGLIKRGRDLWKGVPRKFKTFS